MVTSCSHGVQEKHQEGDGNSKHTHSIATNENKFVMIEYEYELLVTQSLHFIFSCYIKKDGSLF